MWSTMVNHMDTFLSLKEAAEFSGRSESTLKRLIARVLNEHRHDQSLIDQVIKKRQAAKGYFWFISKKFLTEEFALGESVDDHGRSGERPKAHDGEPVDDRMAGQRTLESEIIAILKEQLRVKDEQIRNFQERDREHNILLKAFQDKLFLLESGRGQDDPVAHREQAPDGGRGEETTAADPFGAAPAWPEEGMAEGEQDAPEADVGTEEETAVTDEEMTAAVESAAEEEQAAVAEPSGGEGEAEGVPEMADVGDTGSVQQQEGTAGGDEGMAEQIGRAEETPAPVAAAPVSGEQGAGEGSEVAPPPTKKKGFWRRVFGG